MRKLLVLLTLIIAHGAWSQVPETISYQSVLFDANRMVVADGSYAMTFRLYDAEIGGAELWSETQSVTTANGVFSATLGGGTPLGLTFDRPYWLGLAVEGGAELSPRVRLTASPYSLMAKSVADGAVTSAQIADGTIAAADLADDSVTGAKIADSAVGTANVTDNAITTDKIADGTVSSGDLANGAAVKSVNGLTDAVTFMAGSNVTIIPAGNTLTIAATGTELPDDAVTSVKIADGAVATADVADNAITTAKIVDGTVTAGDLANGAAVKSVNGLMDAVTLAAGSNVTITPAGNTLTIAATGTALPDDAVTSVKIADAAVVTVDLSDGAVTSAKVADGGVAAIDLADGAVTSAKIADGTVAASDLASGAAVKSVNGLTDAVTFTAGSNVTITPAGNTLTIAATGTALPDGAVTSAKIADGAIADADISSSAAIAASKISGLGSAATLGVGTAAGNVVQLDGSGRLPAVDGSQLTGLSATPTDASVTNAKLADASVSSAKIADGTIAVGDLADGSVTTVKIADGTIAAGDLASGATVKSVNGLTDAVTLSAGSNVTITPAGNTLTIAAANGNTLDGAYDQGGAGAGRTITADNGAVAIAGTDGLLATGTFDSGTIPAEGAGARLMWYPKKAAFRVGRVNGTQWDDASIGEYSTVAGGWGNTASGNHSTVAGGNQNSAEGYAATVAGGLQNRAASAYGFAAGRQAKAIHSGAFVWGDDTAADFSSTATNQFLIRASGGVGIGTASPGQPLTVAGTIESTSGGFKFPDGSTQTTAAGGGTSTSAANTFTREQTVDGTQDAVQLKVQGHSTQTNNLMEVEKSDGTDLLTLSNAGKMTVGGTEGLLVTGTFGSGAIPATGAGTRLMWYPKKAAFRAGHVTGSEWDDGSIGDYSTVGGGQNNTASSQQATVGGGNANTASGLRSTVSGGFSNTSSSDYSTIGGGQNNTSSGQQATVGGGNANTSSSDYSTIGGGQNNTAGTSDYTTVGGGYQNTASGAIAVVSGGESCAARGGRATVGGGKNNIATSNYSTIGGGQVNTASGGSATIGGGYNNAASGLRATVGGGLTNSASNSAATVSGGWSNAASGFSATVSGGFANTASGDSATVAGGSSNTAGGSHAAIPGGRGNAAAGDYSFAAGRRAKANHDGAFVWGDGTDADFTSTGTNQFLIRAAGGVGIGTASPGQPLTVAGTIESTTGGFKFPDGSTQTTAAGGGISTSAANTFTREQTVDGTQDAVQLKVQGHSTQTSNLVEMEQSDGTDLLTLSNAGKLSIDGTDGLLVTGTFGSGTIPVEGASTRLMWYPKKAAFRVGKVGSTQWDDASIGDYSTVGGGSNNTASGTSSTISGGGGNQATSLRSTIGGGYQNTASGDDATVGGGEDNTASQNYATVGGGRENTASDYYSTIGGGYLNVVNDPAATIGGGRENRATGSFATVPGGHLNQADGLYSFAAGRRAKANHDGAFVWGDGTDADFTSTAVDQFLIRAAGGVGIGTASPSEQLHVIGNLQFGSTPAIKSVDGGLIITSSGTNVGPTTSLIPTGTGSKSQLFLYGQSSTTVGTRLEFFQDGANSILRNQILGGGANGSIKFEHNGTTNLIIGSDGKVGIGAASPSGKLHVEDGSVLFSGTTGTIPTTGAGTRLMWYPAKGAFRAGTVTGTQWDDGSIGTQSTVAGGYNNTASGARSAVGGGSSNSAGNYATVSGGNAGQAGGDYSAVGGGDTNVASGSSSTAAGGNQNTASGGFSAVGGGANNSAAGGYSTVAGGTNNNADTNNYTTVGGGRKNKASGLSAVISGGESSAASGSYSAVPGGYRNAAAGDYSFAAGRRAHASHAGTFVWGDQTDANFSSTAVDQFLIRASGGVGIGTASPSQPLTVAGTIYSTSGGFKFPDGTTQTTASSGGGNTLDGAYDQGGAGAGRTITADNGAVSIAGTDGLVSSGTFGSGTIPETGAGTRLMWYPKKAAFRAGNVTGTQWDDGSIGDYSTVSGGKSNTASGQYAAVGGGDWNVASATDATVAGGGTNNASGTGAAIGGGQTNNASGYAAFVGGGQSNTASNQDATVGGGVDNIASGAYATVPGGATNTAAGNYSFAAGNRAKANHAGAFVWGDQTAADFTSTAVDQFLIRASGGVGVGTASPGSRLTVKGAGTTSGTSSLAVFSSASSPLLLVRDDGNIGIGAATPTAKLNVRQIAAADIVDVQDSGTTVMKVYDGGIVDLPKQSACRVYRSGAQSLPSGSAVKIQFNAENYDVQGEFDSSTNYRFTATKAGIYHVKAQMQCSSAASQEYTLYIYKNAGVHTHFNFYSTTTNAFFAVSDLVQLSGGDYIEIHGKSTNSAQNITGSTDRTFLTIYKVQ